MRARASHEWATRANGRVGVWVRGRRATRLVQGSKSVTSARQAEVEVGKRQRCGTMSVGPFRHAISAAVQRVKNSLFGAHRQPDGLDVRVGQREGELACDTLRLLRRRVRGRAW